MSMHRARYTGLIVCAIALLVAGCSSSGDAADNAAPAPTGIAHGGHHAKGGKHHPKSGKHHQKRGKHRFRHPGPGAGSPTASAHPSRSSAPAPGNHTSSRPAPRHSSSRPGGGGGGGGESSSPSVPPDLPRIVVRPASGLDSVQTVTVEGFNFTPNTLLAVAECHDRGQDTALPDCNINNVLTYSPGAKVRSDGNGHVGPLQITVRKTFKSVNCAAVKCLVAISEPSLHPDPADEGDEYIHFA